jgi:twitching motility protein PilT
MPRANGQGRAVAAEVMIVTSTIRDLIMDGRVDEIRDYIADGAQYGMRTFDQHLMELVNSGEVAYEVALAAATRPSDFALNQTTLKTGAGRPGMPKRPATRGNTAVREDGGLGPNPLGTGATLPPMPTSPNGQRAVTSPSPFGDDSVFGTGFENMFGQG